MQTMEQTMMTPLNAARGRGNVHDQGVPRDASAYRFFMAMVASLCDGFGDVALIKAGQTLM